MMDVMGNGEIDEFEAFRAQAYNNNNHSRHKPVGTALSLPCTPRLHTYRSNHNDKLTSTTIPEQSGDEDDDSPRSTAGLRVQITDADGETREEYSSDLEADASLLDLAGRPNRIQRSMSLRQHRPSNADLQRRRLSRDQIRTPTFQHHRSQSFKVSFSMPHEEEKQEYEIYKVRAFSTSSKGVISRGNSFKIRRSPSRTLEEEQEAQQPADQLLSPSTLSPLDRASQSRLSNTLEVPAPLLTKDPLAPEVVFYKVLIWGKEGVGKNTLKNQFLTTDFLANNENAPDEESNSIVSIAIDNEECVVEFAILGTEEIEDDEAVADAYVVVYSVTDRLSFLFAADLLSELAQEDLELAPVILVANKQDLVRKRVVSQEDGINMATAHDCKYAEVSAMLNHKVDELLVGTVRQIRLNLENGGRMRERRENRNSYSRDSVEKRGCLNQTCLFFRRLFGKQKMPNKACEDLMI